MAKNRREQMVKLSDYVTPMDAAEIIGCTDGRVYQKLRDGDFKEIIQVGKNRFLIARKECEKIRNSPAKTGRPRIALTG